MSHLWTFWSGFSIVLHSWCTKWYVTYFTFETFVAFMNWVECLFRCWTWVNDLQQDSHLWSLWPPWTLYMCFVKDPARKWFATRFTIVIYMSFMNYVYVLHQIISCRKLFTTGFTLWSLWSVGMCLFKLSAWKNALLQDLHLWSLWPLWFFWMRLFKSPTTENDLLQERHLWAL